MDNRILIFIGLLLMGFVIFLVAHPGGPEANVETQNWTVTAGKEENDSALQALRFLPEEITIHVGDSVTWKLDAQEEHTIYFPAGEPLPALVEVGPDGREYFNPAIFFPSEGQSYDGTGSFSGGVLSGGREEGTSSTFTLTFTKPGVYEYACMFHPGMKGTVTVITAGQPLPMTPADYALMASSEAKQALDAADKLQRQLIQPKMNSRPDGTSEYTLDLVGDTKTMGSVVHFDPTSLHIKVGDTVTWRMLDYTEVHTVTFLDNPDEVPDIVNVEPQENGPPLLVVNPMAWQPAGANTHTGSGYHNSGAMFRQEGALAPTYSLTFTKPGTYEYVCTLHAYMGMKGTVIVESAKSAETSKSPILALVDYTSQTGKAGEADGIAVVDLNPNSALFGKIMQQVSIGPGVRPHHVYYNRDGSKLYTTALGGSRLYHVDMAGDRIQAVTPIDTGPCQMGEDLYFTEDGSKFYLTCMGSDMVVIFDAHTEKMIGQIQAPAPTKPYIKHPHGLAVNEKLDRMIVTSTVAPDLSDPGASVTVIELSSGKVLSTHDIMKDTQGGSAPVEILFLPGQSVVYVTAMLEGSLWEGIWDESTKDFQFKMVDDLTARGQGWPLEMYVRPDGNLYVSFTQPGGVNVYDISNPLAPKFLKTLPADAGAHHIAFSPDGNYMFVQNNLLNLEKMNAGTISVVDLKSGQLTATVDNLVKQSLQPESLVLLRGPMPVGHQSWTVMAGMNQQDEALQALRFLPEEITIHVGDSVAWKLGGNGHSIFFPAGHPEPALIVPGTDGKEYWNPDVFFPSEATSYDGSNPTSGGDLEKGSGYEAFTLTFTKPGVYKYVCVFHPGMKGTVTVLPPDQPLPHNQAEYDQIARGEGDQALRKAQELYNQTLQPQVTQRSDGSKEYMLDMVGDSKTMATVLRFTPSPLHIKVGDTVTWRMLDYTELHTVTFLENPDEVPEFALVEPQPSGAPKLIVNPQAEKPVGGSTHGGGGYFNSGFMLRPEGKPAPTYSLTFTKPGTYEYTCLVHDMLGMKGAIVVEPAQNAEAQPLPAQGFTLHIDAKKHINDMPDQVVHHYCKTLDAQVSQCLLFDSDAPNAHLIGVETIISPEIYAKLPEEEKANWHYHKDEIPLVDAKLPGLSAEEAQKVVASLEDTYGKVVIFWEPGTPAPMGAPSITVPQSHRMKALTIKAKDYSFDAPEQVEAGLVSVTLENNGAELHHVQLARLQDGVTMKDLQDALAKSPEAAVPLLELAGGVSVLPPNGRQEVLLNLKPGHYVMLCFLTSPSDGVPHLAKGMIQSIEVVAPSYSIMAPEPKSDVSISLVDFAFKMPGAVKAGKQIWKITNEGQQPHEMSLIKLADGKTIQDVLSFIQSPSPEGAPPFEMAGGMQALASGKTGWAVLDLPPGNYAALCFVPDPASGKSHAELGMIGAFNVK